MPYASTAPNRRPFSLANFKLRLRYMFSHFGFLFSKFGKYIAPAYYHDRCERSVQMRLYTMHKREFVVVFAVFFACLCLCLFIGLAGPPITTTVARSSSQLLPPNENISSLNMATGPFTLKTPTLSAYSQQLWIIAQVTIKNEDEDETFRKSFHLGVRIQGITLKRQTIDIFGLAEPHIRTRELVCTGKKCDTFTVLHLGFLDYTRYLVTVTFYGLENIDEKYHIQDVTFFYKSYNPSFTQLEIWFRFIFLLITFFITCWFAHTLRRFAFHDWSIEQKWMSILLPCLLLHNDPVFPMSLLVNHWIPGMLDAMFQATFLCSLLLFWLCVYHGIRQNERRLVSFYVPKVLIVGMLWMAAFVLASWQRYNELRDPTYSYKVDTSGFYGLKIFFFTVGSVYLLYLLYLVIQAYTELRSMPYFDVRLKFMTSLMLIVLSLTILITVMRFGISVLEDNFVAELSTSYGNSAEFMSFYGLLNFYLYTMAYVYSPPPNAFLESHVKDNPTLSMINDSDEEVIYGSDAEERLLHPSRSSQDKEESD
ncbi:transmembrane protein 181-like [Ornithodoros turicata]|uniref:transmembrane protein 181-like n=1 Tax=Ornithodoros turicata TaxID=34597 RepID=UPI003139C024